MLHDDANAVGKPGIAVLAGNGLSRAFSDSLALECLTEEILRRFSTLDAGVNERARVALEQVARTHDHNPDPVEDFERLVGAFVEEDVHLESLARLAETLLPGGGDLGEAIAHVRVFTTQMRDVGTSHVLEIIRERTKGVRKGGRHAADDFISALAGMDDRAVTFGNLNYDSLLLSSLLRHHHRCADLAGGLDSREVRLTGEGAFTRVRPLRATAEWLIDQRLTLLHLHGSMTYWKDSIGSFKVDTRDVDKEDVWERLRREDPVVRPLVVLAHPRDKAALVRQEPFKLAFETFEKKLVASSSWVIAGYSFRDDHVNDMLARAVAARATPPRILVVTRGSGLTSSSIAEAIGRRKRDLDLAIDREGIVGAEMRPAFAELLSVGFDGPGQS